LGAALEMLALRERQPVGSGTSGGVNKEGQSSIIMEQALRIFSVLGVNDVAPATLLRNAILAP
jgi:hypothetical protein